jgi:uncharacterized membrane protein
VSALATRVVEALAVLVLVGGPPAAHLALAMRLGTAVAALLIATQAVLIVWIASSSLTQRRFRVGACGIVAALVLVLSRFTDGGPLVASAIPHAMTYLALLVVFAVSLQPGREAVVTILARKARGALSGEIVRYTRRVTWAWCWFFVAQLMGSLVLLLFAPLDAWSLFVNLCNLPVIGAMLCAEYIYRQWRHAAHPPERLADMVRSIRQVQAVPVSHDR